MSSKQLERFINTFDSGITNVNETSKGLVDLHVHLRDDADGEMRLTQLIQGAKRNGVRIVAPLQHNTLAFWSKCVRENNISPMSPVHNINGTLCIPAVEVTCRDTKNKNTKGNAVKMHVLVLAPSLVNNSPLVRLLKIKSENDRMVDFGQVHEIAKIKGISIDKDTIRNYIVNLRQQPEYGGLNSIGSKLIWNFWQECVLKGSAMSNRELEAESQQIREYAKMIPGATRLQLSLEDVIKVSHASGGLVIFAHPLLNLGRTNNPEKTVLNFLKAGGDGIETLSNLEDKTGIIPSILRAISASGKTDILYTGGSDTHKLPASSIYGADGSIILGEPSIGVTTKGAISIESMNYTLRAIEKLESARKQGSLSHKDYDVSISEVNDIIERICEETETENEYYYRKIDELYENRRSTYPSTISQVMQSHIDVTQLTTSEPFEVTESGDNLSVTETIRQTYLVQEGSAAPAETVNSEYFHTDFMNGPMSDPSLEQ